MNNVIVRHAHPSDLDLISESNARIASETEGLTLDPAVLHKGVQQALADSGKATYFIAEINGRFAGQLMVTHEWSDWRNGDIWWVQSVYVMPDFRRRGVFRALYKHVEEEARQTGAVGVRLYVERKNSSAHSAYENLGMEMTHYLVMQKMFK